MLKVDLHVHTSDDPVDAIPYTTDLLIDRAADLGYRALAITLHNRQLDLRPWGAHARERGITLIPGVERTISGKHVLLLNFPDEAERVTTLEEVEAMKRRWPGLVIAPHPFYPAPTCLGRTLEQHAAVFDAIEYNYFYTRRMNWFNAAACRFAARHGKPVVANSDAHRLEQLGITYSLIDAEPDADVICAAIRAGLVERRTEPISAWAAGLHFAAIGIGGIRGRLRPAPGTRRATGGHLPLAGEAD